MNSKVVYLDYCATTPTDPDVVRAMTPYWSEVYGNPSSQHVMGWKAHMAVEESRRRVAQLLGAHSTKEIVFTSGASEANSLALVGYIRALKSLDPQRPLHAMTSQVEHKSVLETFRQLEELGVQVDYLTPNAYGQVEIEQVESKIRPSHTVLMSFMWGNNELGSLNPIEKLGELAEKYGIGFHTDATQVIGKVPVQLNQVKIDFLSLSGHKMYGPKGVGALYVRHHSHHPCFPLKALIAGGGQEGGLRSGTSNVPGIVGFGKACELAQHRKTQTGEHLQSLSNSLYDELLKQWPLLRRNGHPHDHLPGHLHLTFPGMRWDQWLPRLSNLCVSATSACNSDSSQGSHVLRALGFSTDDIQASLRISVGIPTTSDEIELALELFGKALKQASH